VAAGADASTIYDTMQALCNAISRNILRLSSPLRDSGSKLRFAEVTMCVSCGCGQFNDDHGDRRHIILDDLEQAAAASGLSLDEVAQNISEAATVGDGSVPRPPDEEEQAARDERRA
jgi:nitrogen fixation-related uncharacterized protein